MLLSMTGHGACAESEGGTHVSADIRTVNSRYLKIIVRCSEGYSHLEPRLEELVRGQIKRGTLNLQMQIQQDSAEADYRIDSTVLESYRQQLHKLDLAPSIDALLTLPGVVIEQPLGELSRERHWELVRRAALGAMESLQEMRVEEGRAMAADLLDNRDQIQVQLGEIAERAPEVVAGYGQRLVERINKLMEQHGVQAEPATVVREVGIFAERTDISEEIVRLRSHLEQFGSFVQSDDSNGRKLDFLVQEMFRETNTIGSKCNDVEIATRVVRIKSCIDRMREMIQNIE